MVRRGDGIRVVPQQKGRSKDREQHHHRDAFAHGLVKVGGDLPGGRLSAPRGAPRASRFPQKRRPRPQQAERGDGAHEPHQARAVLAGPRAELGRARDAQRGADLGAVGEPPLAEERHVRDERKRAERVHEEVKGPRVAVAAGAVQRELRGEDDQRAQHGPRDGRVHGIGGGDERHRVRQEERHEQHEEQERLRRRGVQETRHAPPDICSGFFPIRGPPPATAFRAFTGRSLFRDGGKPAIGLDASLRAVTARATAPGRLVVVVVVVVVRPHQIRRRAERGVRAQAPASVGLSASERAPRERRALAEDGQVRGVSAAVGGMRGGRLSDRRVVGDHLHDERFLRHLRMSVSGW